MGNTTSINEISNWLLERALRDAEITETIHQFVHKLVTEGIPIYRLNVGGIILHPIMGALDITWDADSDNVTSKSIARAIVTSPEFRNTPFNALARSNKNFERYRLDDPQIRGLFPIFEELEKAGVTDYLIIIESFKRSKTLGWADLPESSDGVMFSFATRRAGGFTDSEIDRLNSLSVPLALAVKVSNERTLATALMETYLGKVSGKNVLDGLVELGAGRTIDCALWYSDLRGSTALAAALDIETYLATIDEYFECTAGAVLDQGGEVLKFIGDGVMAIFPFEETAGPPSKMCNAAVLAAREALSRVSEKNQIRAESNVDPINFGIGLHVGTVMYGNVGTQQRMDLTVTGPAANEVARLESLSKHFKVPVIASSQFAEACEDQFAYLGDQAVQGIKEKLAAHTLPEYYVSN